MTSDLEPGGDTAADKITRTHQYFPNWPIPHRSLLPPRVVFSVDIITVAYTPNIESIPFHKDMPTKMAPVKSYAMLNDPKIKMPTTDSSVGRAEGCRVNMRSLGPWFESELVEFHFLYLTLFTSAIIE